MLIDILEPMGAQFDRLRCEVCQNLFLRPMNTGFLRHAVATVLTVYGIETKDERIYLSSSRSLQQCLPFTVLKLFSSCLTTIVSYFLVATVLTVYGIETSKLRSYAVLDISVATVLTVYGIETSEPMLRQNQYTYCVATVLTVYGIETFFSQSILPL